MSLVVLCFVALTLAPSWWRLRRVRGCIAIDPVVLAEALSSPTALVTPALLARTLQQRLCEGHPQRELASALAEQEAARRVAGCNEALHDLDGALRGGDMMMAGSSRLGTFALSLLVLTSWLRHGGPSWDLLAIFLGGLVGGVSLWGLARETTRVVRQQRRGIDRWVAASLAHGSPGLPESIVTGASFEGGP